MNLTEDQKFKATFPAFWESQLENVMTLGVVTICHTKYDIMQSLNGSNYSCTSLTIDSCFVGVRERQTEWFYKSTPFFFVFTRIPQLLLNKCNWNWPGFISDKNKSTIKSNNRLKLGHLHRLYLLYTKPFTYTYPRRRYIKYEIYPEIT